MKTMNLKFKFNGIWASYVYLRTVDSLEEKVLKIAEHSSGCSDVLGQRIFFELENLTDANGNKVNNASDLLEISKVLVNNGTDIQDITNSLVFASLENEIQDIDSIHVIRGGF